MKHLAPTHSLPALAAISAAALLAACTTLPQSPPAILKAATGATLAGCTALASQLKLEHTRIESVAPVQAGTLKLASRDVAEHCLVKGRMHERKGNDGRDYALGFEMRLPLAWNGRFYYQGNGGLDGTVQRIDIPSAGASGLSVAVPG